MGDVLVLCYHAVSDAWDHPMSVRPAALRAQLEAVLSAGYRPATFLTALEQPAGRTVVVTFDDGFRNTFDVAYPVLADLGVPGTVFLPTALIGPQRPLAWPGFDPEPLPSQQELIPMTWEQAVELADAGWEVGSHSCTHPVLTELDDAALRRELAQSRDECEQHLGRPCHSIAYPFGQMDRRVCEAAAAAGYRAGASLTPWSSPSGSLAVGRVGVYRRDSASRFALKISPPLRSRPGALAVGAVKASIDLVRRIPGPRQRPTGPMS